MPFERQEEQPLLELAVRVEEGEEQGEGEEQWLAGGGGHQGQHDCLDTYLCLFMFITFHILVQQSAWTAEQSQLSLFRA